MFSRKERVRDKRLISETQSFVQQNSARLEESEKTLIQRYSSNGTKRNRRIETWQ
jgi:hypothetical protein